MYSPKVLIPTILLLVSVATLVLVVAPSGGNVIGSYIWQSDDDNNEHNPLGEPLQQQQQLQHDYSDTFQEEFEDLPLFEQQQQQQQSQRQLQHSTVPTSRITVRDASGSSDSMTTVVNRTVLTILENMTEFAFQIVLSTNSNITVGSVQMELKVLKYNETDQTTNYVMIKKSTEGTAPYTLCGNVGFTYLPCTDLVAGSYALVVRLYTKPFGKGSLLRTTTTTFEIVETSCHVPKFAGGLWQEWTPYPIYIGESIGGFVQKADGIDTPKFVVLSGFANSFGKVTPKIYSFDTKATATKTNPWIEQDDIPKKLSPGITHSSFVIVDETVYVVGGYVGGTPGPHTNVTFQFRMNDPIGTQHKLLPILPDGGRGAGALLYIKKTNSLLYTSGAIRPVRGVTLDRNQTWELELSNLDNGWQERTPIPYHGNHVSFVSVPTIWGLEQKHYVFGGQVEEDEPQGNLPYLYEYLADKNEWIQRQDMYFPRGHTPASTIAHNYCGFITAGGSVNGPKKAYTKTSDIAYYDIHTDTWTKIGDLPDSVGTPICDIAHYSNNTIHYMYCQTSYVTRSFSWRRRIFL